MKLSGEFKIILGAALFIFIPIGVKMDTASSLCSLIFGRQLIACLTLSLVNRKKKDFFRLEKKEVYHLIIWAVLMLMAMLLYFYAIKTVGVAISSALLGIQPLIIVLMSVIFIKETITTKTFIASILTLLGVLAISDLSNFMDKPISSGQFSAILSAVCLGFVFVYQKKFLLKLDTQKAVFYQSFFQLPFLLPLFIIYPPVYSSNYFSAIVLLGIVATVISYGLIYSGVKSVSVQKIGVLQSVEYVIPVFLGLFLYDEHMEWNVIFGIILVLSASILVQVKLNLKRKKLRI